MLNLEELKLDENNLIPVIAQDYKTGYIRMLAYANKEAIEKTIQTGLAHYYSRSRKKLWKKGEESGNIQEVLDIRIDCDNDTLVYIVRQKGFTCHTGKDTCFFKSLKKEIFPFEIIPLLEEVLQKRIEEKSSDSYTYRIWSEGLDRVLQKFGEESIESLIALKNQNNKESIYELADLMYFLLLSLKKSFDGSFFDILEELVRRYKNKC